MKNKLGEILEYIKEGYPPNQIADTAEVSPAYVYRLVKAFERMTEEGAGIKPEDITLDMLNDFVYKKSIINSTEYAATLNLLKERNSTLASVYNRISSADDIHFRALKKYKYGRFTQLIKKYCTDNGLSDRTVFKPWEYMEVGYISTRSANPDVADMPKRLCYYAYLPYSRTLWFSVPGFMTPEDLAAFVQECFIKMNGIPDKIISSVKLSDLTAGNKNGVFTGMLHHYRRMFSVDKRHAVFRTMEQTVVEKAENGFRSTSVLGSILEKHNMNGPDVLRKEEPVPDNNILPAEEYCISRYVRTVGTADSHIKLQGRFYSCPYKYAGLKVETFRFPDYVRIEDSEGNKLAMHQYTNVARSTAGKEYKIRYVTDSSHLPADWSKTGKLISPYVYISAAMLAGPETCRLVQGYIEEAGFYSHRNLYYWLSNLPVDFEERCIRLQSAKKGTKAGSILHIAFSELTYAQRKNLIIAVINSENQPGNTLLDNEENPDRPLDFTMNNSLDIGDKPEKALDITENGFLSNENTSDSEFDPTGNTNW